MYSPECMGLVCAAVYILILMLFIPFAFSGSIIHRANGSPASEGINVVDFPHHQASYMLYISQEIFLMQLAAFSLPFLPSFPPHSDYAWLP